MENCLNNNIGMLKGETTETHFLLEELKVFCENQESWFQFLKSKTTEKKVTKQRWDQFILVEAKKKNLILNASLGEDGYIKPFKDFMHIDEYVYDYSADRCCT